MKRLWILVAAMAVLSWTAGSTFAQTETPAGQPSATPQMQSTPENANQATVGAGANADANADVTVIKEKAKHTPAKEALETDKKLRDVVKRVDAEATTKGEQAVASRLATELNMTADALIAERGTYQTGWGDLMIAHTLAANAKSTVTVADLFQMKKDGMGWGQIAHGLDLNLGSVVSAVKAEGRVATGVVKADGKMAKIHAESAHANANANANANAGAHVGNMGHTNTDVSTNAGAGVGATVKGSSGK